ncbi:peptidase [Sphingorhabdus lutea]|uniref:Peptidase n=2 Tax=Sphingorhabdus lutea TaxID=1913578 RepID=A0A1L3JEK2_9SPHN|nr:peptidase [Sphingorhabdus lutea]
MATILGGISIATPAIAQFKLGKIVGAAEDLAKAEQLNDADMKQYFDQMAAEMDKLNPVAGPKDPYGKRLATLTSELKNHDGLDLDIKAYLVVDVNAFAMANGTIRIFAGLMDEFTDDEIRYVIGHEIGHVKKEHTKKRMQNAFRLSALQKGAEGAGGKIGRLASGDLSKLFNDVITAQHSQGNEKEADDYAMAFMKEKSYDPMACVTALEKLGGGGDGLPWLQTHPSPKERAKRMRKALNG